MPKIRGFQNPEKIKTHVKSDSFGSSKTAESIKKASYLG
jgi:hypothetical protein